MLFGFEQCSIFKSTRNYRYVQEEGQSFSLTFISSLHPTVQLQFHRIFSTHEFSPYIDSRSAYCARKHEILTFEKNNFRDIPSLLAPIIQYRNESSKMAWLLVSANRCRTIIGETIERSRDAFRRCRCFDWDEKRARG